MLILTRMKRVPSLHPTISKVTASPFPIRKGTSGLVHSLATLSCSQSASSSCVIRGWRCPRVSFLGCCGLHLAQIRLYFRRFTAYLFSFPLNVPFLRRLPKEQRDLGWTEEWHSLRTVGWWRPPSSMVSKTGKEEKHSLPLKPSKSILLHVL